MNSNYFRGMAIIKFRLALICFLWFGALAIRADDRYVVPTNAGALYPFGAWTNAATNIQDAVNAATNGETVWITNGTYFYQGISTCVYTWGAATIYIYTNTAMVVITNAITVRSVNGYSNTVVDGSWPTWTTRVFMVNNTGAVISGLTITNGFVYENGRVGGGNGKEMSGAGVYMCGGLLTNCLITGNVVSNDTVTLWGGGVAMDIGIVSHCIIKGNKGWGAGGDAAAIIVHYGSAGGRMVTDCLISDNYVQRPSGEGSAVWIYYGVATMQWSTVCNNSVFYGIRLQGGGNYVQQCVISNNSTYGVAITDNGNVYNCLIINGRNYGVYFQSAGALKNCTIMNNVGGFRASAIDSVIENNIIFYNGNNWLSTQTSYTNCCTYPMPSLGSGNITNAPLLVDTNAGNYRLSVNSPCINAGMNQDWMNNAVDLDGRKRIINGTVDIGAYEYLFRGTVFYVR